MTGIKIPHNILHVDALSLVDDDVKKKQVYTKAHLLKNLFSRLFLIKNYEKMEKKKTDFSKSVRTKITPPSLLHRPHTYIHTYTALFNLPLR